MKNELTLKINEISNLKSELEQKNAKIEALEKKITELNSTDNQKNKNNELEELCTKLKEKEKEIENLNSQLIGSIKYDDIKLEEKLIAVNFISSDSKTNFPILCKSTSIFSEIERILYKKYPAFAEKEGEDNSFLANGVKMKGFKTMAENGFTGYDIMTSKNN